MIPLFQGNATPSSSRPSAPRTFPLRGGLDALSRAPDDPHRQIVLREEKPGSHRAWTQERERKARSGACFSRLEALQEVLEGERKRGGVARATWNSTSSSNARDKAPRPTTPCFPHKLSVREANGSGKASKRSATGRLTRWKRSSGRRRVEFRHTERTRTRANDAARPAAQWTRW